MAELPGFFHGAMPTKKAATGKPVAVKKLP
jgi:hypothetical protein